MHRIEQVIPHRAMCLEIRFAGEPARVRVDLTELASRGNVFARFADPAYFDQVRIGEGGRHLVWPGEVDLCADALWEQAHGKPALTAARGAA